MAFNKARALQEAENLASQGKISHAIDRYFRILEKDPSELILLNAIGDLYVRDKNVEAGLKQFYRLAEAYVHSGYTLKAIAIYKKIVKLEPDSVGPLLKLGELYQAQSLGREMRELYYQVAEFYKKKNQNAIAITFGSEKVLTYLTRELGVPLGQERKTVPKWIIEASMKVKIAFIRGLFDADGSLIFSKKHHQTEVYPSIELKSVDQEILEWVQRTLWELSFRATLGRSVESYVLRINGEEMLKRWMDVIGSSNIKHISKFQVWRRFGYCPPSTKVPDRIRFLKQGAIDL